MLNDLFINTLLLISFTFIAGHIIKDIPKRVIQTLWGKLVLGIGGGSLGILLMFYTIQVIGTTTLLDLRVIAIMMVSFIGGIIPTIITGIIIGLFRVYHFGLNLSGVFALCQILLYVLSYDLIDKRIESEWKRWITKLLISLLILNLTFGYLLRSVEDSELILLQYSAVILVVGILEFYLLDYVKTSNDLYKRYKKDSTRDYLTGLYNTRYFDKVFNDTFDKVLKNHENLSCLMIDIDHFKKVNDTYGHAVGDIVLKELANILKQSCTTCQLIGRIGGEEFCALLLNTTRTNAVEIAEQIRMAVKAHRIMIDSNQYLNITVSIGVSTYPESTADIQCLKELADHALYDAKNSGRNKVCQK